MEALIGATYVSNDIETARQLVMRLIGPLLKDAAALGAGTDWKTSIQELAASRQLGTINYAVEGSGPDHARTFAGRAPDRRDRLRNGTGNSKKEAEQEAAADAWRRLRAADPQTRPSPTPGSRRRRPAGCGNRQLGPPLPELPEVEVVRRGLVSWVRGRTITAVEVLDPRSIRRHALGPEDFAGNLAGARVLDVVRRGKFLWLPLLDTPRAAGTRGAPRRVALMAHLGMCGQLLMQDAAVPDEKHLKVRLRLSPADGMPDQLRFVDQRIFGGLFVTSLIPTADGGPGGLAEAPLPLIAEEAAHIARDPLDPHFLLRRLLPPAADPQDRPQTGTPGPGAGLRHRQHLRGRGTVAGPAALCPAHRHPAPRRRRAGPRRRP